MNYCRLPQYILFQVIASCHGSTVAGQFDWQSFKHLARNVAVKSYNTVKGV